MPCLLAVFALAAPRITLLALWFLQAWFRELFPNLLWPILGLIFLPTTLLWYTAVQHWFGGEWGIVPIAGVIVTLAIDVSPAGSRRRAATRD